VSATRSVAQWLSPRERIKLSARLRELWTADPTLTNAQVVAQTAAPMNVVNEIRKRLVLAGVLKPCETCNGDRFIEIPTGHADANGEHEEWTAEPCPDCDALTKANAEHATAQAALDAQLADMRRERDEARAWRASAIRYSDKVEAERDELRAALASEKAARLDAMGQCATDLAVVRAELALAQAEVTELRSRHEAACAKCAQLHEALTAAREELRFQQIEEIRRGRRAGRDAKRFDALVEAADAALSADSAKWLAERDVATRTDERMKLYDGFGELLGVQLGDVPFTTAEIIAKRDADRDARTRAAALVKRDERAAEEIRERDEWNVTLLGVIRRCGETFAHALQNVRSLTGGDERRMRAMLEEIAEELDDPALASKPEGAPKPASAVCGTCDGIQVARVLVSDEIDGPQRTELHPCPECTPKPEGGGAK
jgi:hypothetical protein